MSQIIIARKEIVKKIDHKRLNFYFIFPLISASTARSYLYGVQIGQCRVLPSTTQIKSEAKRKEFRV